MSDERVLMLSDTPRMTDAGAVGVWEEMFGHWHGTEERIGTFARRIEALVLERVSAVTGGRAFGGNVQVDMDGAVREAIRLATDLLWTDPDPEGSYTTVEERANQEDLRNVIKAIDRAVLAARLEQAEKEK